MAGKLRVVKRYSFLSNKFIRFKYDHENYGHLITDVCARTGVHGEEMSMDEARTEALRLLGINTCN